MNRDYEVGGHRFRVTGAGITAALDCLTGFRPFLTDKPVALSIPGSNAAEPEFIFREGEQSQIPALHRLLYPFQYEDISSTFGKTADDCYLLGLHPAGEEPLRLWTECGSGECRLYGNLSPRLLRFALWMGFGIMTAWHGTVAVHSSCIVYRGKAVLFLGESGTGKSTHTRLWREHIAGSTLLNDDSPIVRCEGGGLWVYGSPWSGKTPCYKAERYPLAGCVRLSQASGNSIRRLDTMRGFAAFHPSTPPAFAYDGRLYDGICATMNGLLPSVPVYHLSCLPDRAAAELSCHTLFGEMV